MGFIWLYRANYRCPVFPSPGDSYDRLSVRTLEGLDRRVRSPPGKVCLYEVRYDVPYCSLRLQWKKILCLIVV